MHVIVDGQDERRFEEMLARAVPRLLFGNGLMRVIFETRIIVVRGRKGRQAFALLEELLLWIAENRESLTTESNGYDFLTREYSRLLNRRSGWWIRSEVVANRSRPLSQVLLELGELFQSKQAYLIVRNSWWIVWGFGSDDRCPPVRDLEFLFDVIAASETDERRLGDVG